MRSILPTAASRSTSSSRWILPGPKAELEDGNEAHVRIAANLIAFLLP